MQKEVAKLFARRKNLTVLLPRVQSAVFKLKLYIMKKLIFVACASLALLSCEKEPLCSSCIEPINPTAEENTTTNTQKVTDSKYLTWHDNGASDFGCWDRGGNCGHTITVSAIAAVELNNIFTIINANNNLLVRKTFEENKTFLSRYIPSSTIGAVITGEYNVKARGADAESIRYMIFSKAADSEIVFVYPLVLK